MKHLRSGDELCFSAVLLDIPFGAVFIPPNQKHMHMKVNNGKEELQSAIDLTNGIIRKFNTYDFVTYFPNAYYSAFEIPEMLED